MSKDSSIVRLKEEPKLQSVSEEPKQHHVPEKKRKNHSAAIVLSLGIALLVPAGAGLYLYLADSQIDIPTPAVENEAEVSEDAIEKVRKHILLPEGEVPVVATVSDPEKLRDQPFFKDAKPGYIVLIYTESKKAYLYDPERDVLVEVSQITTDLQ